MWLSTRHHHFKGGTVFTLAVAWSAKVVAFQLGIRSTFFLPYMFGTKLVFSHLFLSFSYRLLVLLAVVEMMMMLPSFFFLCFIYDVSFYIFYSFLNCNEHSVMFDNIKSCHFNIQYNIILSLLLCNKRIFGVPFVYICYV